MGWWVGPTDLQLNQRLGMTGPVRFEVVGQTVCNGAGKFEAVLICNQSNGEIDRGHPASAGKATFVADEDVRGGSDFCMAEGSFSSGL